MNADIVTRLATQADASALARFNADFSGASDPPDALADRLARFGHIETTILAEVGGEAAGFACLRVSPCVLYAEPHAELTELYVAPAFRRLGVATALFRSAEQLARERGATKMNVLADLNNADGQAFYRAMGYAPDDVSFVGDL